jgi:hypothetical protein
MPQRASVFCNFYIRVDREALVSERALNVGSVAVKAMSTKNKFCRSYCDCRDVELRIFIYVNELYQLTGDEICCVIHLDLIKMSDAMLAP